jgi:hypothetical protein
VPRVSGASQSLSQYIGLYWLQTITRAAQRPRAIIGLIDLAFLPEEKHGGARPKKVSARSSNSRQCGERKSCLGRSLLYRDPSGYLGDAIVALKSEGETNESPIADIGRNLPGHVHGQRFRRNFGSASTVVRLCGRSDELHLFDAGCLFAGLAD